MTDRPRVEGEEDLHSTMYAKDILGGATKGTAAGAALGALLKHTGHGVGPGALAAAGAILGGGHGALRGRERSMRDVVTQQRMHQRAEARSAKRHPAQETKEAMSPYESRVWASFAEELTKESNFLTSTMQGIGSRVIGGATRAAKAVGMGGPGGTWGNIVRGASTMSGGGANLARNVGIGTVGLGGLGLMAAGRSTAPGPRY